jgi:hypothetical protein
MNQKFYRPFKLTFTNGSIHYEGFEDEAHARHCIEVRNKWLRSDQQKTLVDVHEIGFDEVIPGVVFVNSEETEYGPIFSTFGKYLDYKMSDEDYISREETLENLNPYYDAVDVVVIDDADFRRDR